MYRCTVFFLCSVFCIQLRAQILPKEGSRLNYRLVAFSFPAQQGYDSCAVEVAAVNSPADALMIKKTGNNSGPEANRVFVQVPAFGQQYSWRVLYSGKGKRAKTTPIYHFSTMASAKTDTSKLRLRILEPATQQYKDGYIGVDGGNLLYDMEGNPVWFLPDVSGTGDNTQDMKFTARGTVTLLAGQAYELNFDGSLIWRSPAKASVGWDTARDENFHHEFTRLPGGHYMALGLEQLMCKQVSVADSNYILVDKDVCKSAEGYRMGRFGTLIEYDAQGKVVWSWRSQNYLLYSDFVNFNPHDTDIRFDAHENAFYVDAVNNAIYLGYRNLNRIIKISYPGGRVLAEYGEVYERGGHDNKPGLFCGQHSIGKTVNDELMVFNNNSCRSGDVPAVVLAKEPGVPGSTAKKRWEYQCVAGGAQTGVFNKGGNVTELPGGALLVNMGSRYSQLSIVNRDKKVLWSALPERLNEPGKWSPAYQYRATAITRSQLEQMVWNAEQLPQH